MEGNITPGLEKALADAEIEADNALKAAHQLNLALKRYSTSLKTGVLKDIQTTMNDVEKAELTLRQQIATAKAGWIFDVDTYFNNGDFIKEILVTAEQKGVRIFERDDRLYSYPVLIRLLPSERTVLIDKTREKRLRPTVLVNRLKDIQKKPPRFRPEPFMEALHSAYRKALQFTKQMKKDAPDPGSVIPLLDIYELLTLLPGQTREYSRQEFARDIYLLDRSGIIDAKGGSRLSLPASTGTKISSHTLNIINEFGEEKRYYGIAFTAKEP
jgi:hypothetical protein